jgi:hypothetical protein
MQQCARCQHNYNELDADALCPTCAGVVKAGHASMPAKESDEAAETVDEVTPAPAKGAMPSASRTGRGRGRTL